MLFINNVYSFDSNNPGCKYDSFSNHRPYSVYQVPAPLLIVFDDNWDTKGIHGPVCFSQPGDGYEKNVTLNSASASMEYNQIFQSYFG